MIQSVLFSAVFWDPSPVAFQISVFSISWYSLFFAIGFFLAAWIVKKLASPSLLSEAEYERFVWYVFVGMLIGARLGHVLFYDFSYYVEHPQEILMIWHGGLASHGGTLGMLLTIWIFSKQYQKPGLQLLDSVAIAAPLAGCCVRIGNFFNQEIVGTPSSLPWAVRFGHPMENIQPVSVHPAQLYEALFYLILFCVSYFWLRKIPGMKQPGKITGIQVLALFSGRIVLEIFKAPQIVSETSWLSRGQLLSLPFLALGLYLALKNEK